MREFIVDCKGQKTTWRDFTPEEEAARLAEIIGAEAAEREAERARRTRALLDAEADLERAEALRAEGALSDGDVVALRDRADALKAELTPDS